MDIADIPKDDLLAELEKRIERLVKPFRFEVQVNNRFKLDHSLHIGVCCTVSLHEWVDVAKANAAIQSEMTKCFYSLRGGMQLTSIEFLLTCSSTLTIFLHADERVQEKPV